MGRGRARGGQGSPARVVPEFGRAGRSVGYGWSAVVTRRTMRAGRDVREEVGTLSFTPASLFVALVLLYFQPITASIIFKKSAATHLENVRNSSSLASWAS